MRSFYLTFTSDDVDKIRIFGTLLDAGLKDFVITETEQFTYENWKRTVAKNETAHMDYETAKSIMRNYFLGVRQPVAPLLEALKTLSEDDYNAIQKSVEEKETVAENETVHKQINLVEE